MAFWRAKYGEETTSSCPLCSRPAIMHNSQGVAVCSDHKNASISASCPSCHTNLELRDGKFGKFFLCASCGPISMKKASFEKPIAESGSQPANQQANTTEKRVERANAYKNPDGTDNYVRSDDPRFEFR